MLKGRRAVFVRLLWILATYGSVEESNLSVDSIAISTHKKGTTGFPTTEAGWKRWLEILSKIGIHGEMKFANLEKDQFITPIGWLRDRIPGTEDPVWHLVISFNEKLGSGTSLADLQRYAFALSKKYGKRAFSRFSKLDMRVFEK